MFRLTVSLYRFWLKLIDLICCSLDEADDDTYGLQIHLVRQEGAASAWLFG
jgi:hypothetical protein